MRVAYLQEMLRAEPWIHHALTERCDLVVSLCQQHAKRTEERGLTLTQVVGDAAGGGGGGANRLGAGTGPKHCEPLVHLALASIAYTEFKRGVVQRLAKGSLRMRTWMHCRSLHQRS